MISAPSVATFCNVPSSQRLTTKPNQLVAK